MKNNILSRRDFISGVAAGLAVMALHPSCAPAGKEFAGAWKKGMHINPAIDNFRVVNCLDPSMVTADPKNWDCASQNAPVVADKVCRNLEALACALARKNRRRQRPGRPFSASPRPNNGLK